MSQTTKEIQAQFKKAIFDEWPDLINYFSSDKRQSINTLCKTYQKKYDKLLEENSKWEEKILFDKTFLNNQKILVGVDEVGRGPLAGPVVAAAVILPQNAKLVGLKDSKKLSEAKREELYHKIKEQAIAYGIGIIDALAIDKINILQATFLAMQQALDNLKITYDIILVDGDKKIPEIKTTQYAIVKGDDKSASIAAASVLAKVTRDKMMREYAITYPQYDWINNKGYGSAKHYQAIQACGLSPLHRQTFIN
jgi:ribonuclease HII